MDLMVNQFRERTEAEVFARLKELRAKIHRESADYIEQLCGPAIDPEE